ncbi:MAG TPA: DUF2271 domain-containing protein [Verrucomicrobiae bacterium]|nr:DUF2271 domain-containing protein [Verrucomicrobiae bacterium]
MKLPLLTSAAFALSAAPALAADLRVDIEIPRLSAAEYHAPYVAVWIESPDQTAIGTLSVWYDVDLRNNEGLTWLADMRTWWRKNGRTLTLPADGVSGATRAPGNHSVTFRAANATLRDLPAGQYNVVVEAARELGNRELVRVPFTWGGAANNASGQGSSELGAISVAVTR